MPQDSTTNATLPIPKITLRCDSSKSGYGWLKNPEPNTSTMTAPNAGPESRIVDPASQIQSTITATRTVTGNAVNKNKLVVHTRGAKGHYVITFYNP